MFGRKINMFRSVIQDFYKKNIVITADEGQFLNFKNDIIAKYPLPDNDGGRIILVPLINDTGTMKIATELSYKIAYERQLKIKYFYVHSAVDNPVKRQDLLRYIFQQLQNCNIFWIGKLCRIYGIRRRDVIMSNFFWPGFKEPQKNYFTDKNEVLNIKFNGIRIGELIYDTYLRFRSKYTLEMDDVCLADIIRYSKRLVQLWSDFIKSTNIEALITPYTAYHHWGIPSYVFLNQNIDVITFGSYNYIVSNLSVQHPYHSKNFNLFKQKFRQIPNEEMAIKKLLAKQTLEQRLGGQIDSGTSYMKNTAFSSEYIVDFSPGKDKSWCVIFLHCFFDSPHIYGDSLFADFYEWVIYFLKRAVDNSDKVYYVKEHPNALPDNKEVVSFLKESFSQYSNIVFLSSKVSNQQILQKRPDAIFTVYGTVAHEFAFKGIPVVVAGKNPQSDYDFTHKPDTIEDFNYYIDNVGRYKLPEFYNPEEIYEFFYMNYLYYSNKCDSSNFTKALNMDKGVINLPLETPIDDLFYDTNK